MTSGALATILVLLGATSASWESVGRTAWFLNSYLPASRRIEHVYSHLTMQAVTEYVDGPRKGDVRYVHYTAFGGRYRIDAQQSPDGAPLGAMIVSERHSVIIHRSDSCRLRGVCRVESAPADVVLEQMRLSVRLPFAPWCFCRNSIRQILLDEKTRISRVRLDVDDRYGRVCVVDWGTVEQQRVRQEGRFRFAVDRAWVLLAGEVQLGSAHRIGINCTYGDEEIAGVPVIRTAELWHQNATRLRFFRSFRRTSCDALTASPDVFDPTIECIIAELSASGPVGPRWQYSPSAGILGTSLLLAVCIPFYWRRKGPFGSGLVANAGHNPRSIAEASPVRQRPGAL